MKIALFAFFIALFFAIAVPEAPPAFRPGQIARQNAARQTQNNDAKQAAPQEGQGKNGNTKNTNPVMNWFGNQMKRLQNTFESAKRKVHQGWTNTFNKKARNAANQRSNGAKRSQNAQNTQAQKSQTAANKAGAVAASKAVKPITDPNAPGFDFAKLPRIDEIAGIKGKGFRIKVVKVDGKKALEENTAGAYFKFIKAAKAKGYNLGLEQGFRNARDQVDVFYKANGAIPRDVPVSNFGVFRDGRNMLLKSNSKLTGAKLKEMEKWVIQNASKFGFCLNNGKKGKVSSNPLNFYHNPENCLRTA